MKFDPRKLAKLNDPNRLEAIRPDIIWKILDLKNQRIIVVIDSETVFSRRNSQEKFPMEKFYACDSSPVMIGWMRENLKKKHHPAAFRGVFHSAPPTLKFSHGC